MATYPEPETEKERSPLDYPQVSIGYAQLHADCVGITCTLSQPIEWCCMLSLVCSHVAGPPVTASEQLVLG